MKVSEKELTCNDCRLLNPKQVSCCPSGNWWLTKIHMLGPKSPWKAVVCEDFKAKKHS